MTNRGELEGGSGDLVVCMEVEWIRGPFDAGQSVEIKFKLEPCHGVKWGSHMQIIIDADMVNLYHIGDRFSIHMRPM